MSNETNTTASTSSSAAGGAWPAKFGTLVDVTERDGQKGKFITFKAEGKNAQGEPFPIYGACFNSDIIEEMKAAVGKRVWMKGPVDTRIVDGQTKKSFKVMFFRLSDEAKTGETAKAEAEAEAA